MRSHATAIWRASRSTPRSRSATARFRENLLFTHRGLSGPAILQISSYWDGRSPLSIDLLPDVDAVAWLADHRRSSARLDTLLSEKLPRRFAQQWCEAHDAARPLCKFAADERRRASRRAARWPVLPSGTLGYDKAEVTVGGVDTRDLSSKTMAATRVPGLLLHRRGRRRHRLARRLQFPVGVGVGARGGIGGVAIRSAIDAASTRGGVPCTVAVT